MFISRLFHILPNNLTMTGNTPTISAPPKTYSIKDFFSNPETICFRLSDDGAMLGFMKPVSINGQASRMNIFVQALQGSTPVGQQRQLTEETERDIKQYFWKGSNTIIYEKDFNGDENFHVLTVNVTTGKLTDLTPFPGVLASIQDSLDDDPEHILISHNQRNPEVSDVYRANIHTGELTLVAKNPGNIVEWQTDHQGLVRAAITSDGLHSTVLYRDTEDQDFRPIITTDFRTTINPEFFTFDNKKLYALSNRGRDCRALVIIDPAQPDREELVFEVDGVDLNGAGYSRLRQVLTLAVYQTDKSKYHFFDEISKQRQARVEEKLPGYEVTLQNGSRDETKYIIATENDRTPGSRYIYDVNANTLDKLADINPALPEHDMAPMQPIQYQSRDGLTIHGYLTLPLGRSPKNLPCIVNPHGGPWSRNSWGFNSQVQFLANRGYCVLQMNFRGSTGYGRKFWEASFGQWGLAMQDDITDGVQWLIAQGIADPARIAIYGASYGGYATLAGVTYTPDLYAAAVDYVGVSNLFTFMNTIPPYWKPLLATMHSMVGDPAKDYDRLAATSPALNADKIKTPLFIAQGAHDPRVNKNESDQMVAALRSRGVDVEYMVKDNEGHGFHNDENRFEFYENMEAFLRKYLRP